MRCADRGSERGSERGVALLEVLVALAVLIGAGAGLVALAAQSADAVKRAREADSEMRRANAFLEVVSLWPRADLDRHLGDRVQGRWRPRIDRPSRTIYLATLTDSTGGRELLRTALFRPDSTTLPHATP